METKEDIKIREILEKHEIPSLSDKTLAALEKIKSKGEAELTGK